jgi:DNA-binding winged helix-turn-helix (wHTH) protein
VTSASLDELVKVLRRALSDDAKQPRYIKTHPGGRGFSFCWQPAARRIGPAEFRL